MPRTESDRAKAGILPGNPTARRWSNYQPWSRRMHWDQDLSMNSAQRLHELGQRLWLDNLSRELLESGTLARYIRELALTGLTSNPTIFDTAIRHGALYDRTIRR